MGIEPKIQKRPSLTKTCARCHLSTSTDDFAPTHSIFYEDHLLPICNSCVDDYLREHDYSWDAIDKLCQWADIPFIVKEWVRIQDLNDTKSIWPVYSRVFAAECYRNLGWADYNKQYIALREAGLIEDEIPLVNDKRIHDLQAIWGANYEKSELEYLEDLYSGLLATQNVTGSLQEDQARKICKLSLEIDSRIRAGDKEVDKFLSSYDKLIKAAEFTPKNAKNASEFDSFAEVGMWLEKRGRQNKFYDGTTRDIIDEAIKNIEAYNQRLYINEGGIGDEITKRIEGLKSVSRLEEGSDMYDLKPEFDIDEYENEVYKKYEEDDFDPSGGMGST